MRGPPSLWFVPTVVVSKQGTLHRIGWWAEVFTTLTSHRSTFAGIEVLEQICCTRCQEESEPLVSSSWLYYVYSSSVRYVELRVRVKEDEELKRQDVSLNRKVHERHSRMPFDKTLQIIADQDLRPCPNEVQYVLVGLDFAG
jgi:hypothetical protein